MTNRLAPGCQSRSPPRSPTAGGGEGGPPPWRTLSGYLRQLFGRPLRKVPLDPGFGCPHRDRTTGRGGCSFCREDGFVPVNARAGGSVGDQLDRALGRSPGLAQGCLAYFQGGSGTFAPTGRFAAAVEEVFRRPAVKGLFVGTRPDCVEEGHLRALDPWEGRRLLWLELGLPSSSEATLQRVGRGHGTAWFRAARELARRHGLPVCAHVILGLPGEGADEVRATADFLAGEEVEGVKLHPLLVLRGTAMEEVWRRGEVEPLPLARYASLAADFLGRLPSSTIVHRVSAEAPAGLVTAPGWNEGAAGVRGAVAREVRRRRGQRGGAAASQR